MKNNLKTLNHACFTYLTFQFNILLNILTINSLYLLIICYKITLHRNILSKLNNKLLNSVWVRSIIHNRKHILIQPLSKQTTSTVNNLPSLQMIQVTIVSSNYSSLLCVKMLKVFNISLHVRLLTYFSNFYYKNILNYNNYSMLIAYYLINNCNIQTLINKPINTNKSLFIINIKKL